MKVELRYIDGCPNWIIADARLLEALLLTGHDDVKVHRTRVETPEQAESLGLIGSPTVLIDGLDPFASGAELGGLACRVYLTPEGLAGSPTLEQLLEVLS
ncbi:MAG TPA: thioredoxin family protein [Jiangellaceae bacterium]|nr:thioredoxin family protein [Jiangellaceae bacterium]